MQACSLDHLAPSVYNNLIRQQCLSQLVGIKGESEMRADHEKVVPKGSKRVKTAYYTPFTTVAQWLAAPIMTPIHMVKYCLCAVQRYKAKVQTELWHETSMNFLQGKARF